MLKGIDHENCSTEQFNKDRGQSVEVDHAETRRHRHCWRLWVLEDCMHENLLLVGF